MAKVTGTPGDDLLTGTPAADEIEGLAGDDALHGGAGDDLLLGGLDDDLLAGGRGDDSLAGGAGTDKASWAEAPGRGQGGLYGVWVSLEAGRAEAVLGRLGDGSWRRDGTVERDLIQETEDATGSRFADFLRGDAGTNLLHGLDGRDEIEGLAGDDVLHGGLGADAVRGDAGDDTLHGGSGADELLGGAGRDALHGGWGADRLAGGVGDDRLHGGEGDDRFTDGPLPPEPPGRSGDDRYDGGAGRDAVDFQHLGPSADGSGVAVSLAEASGVGTAVHGAETDRLLGIEDVAGTDGDDRLTGNAEANLLVGLGGDDLLYGMGGDDTLLVGSEVSPGGSNLAHGGAGDDAVRGWGGSDDALRGGSGADRLEGGTQALELPGDRDRLDLGADADPDTVVFALTESVAGSFGSGVDLVTAFDPAADLLAIELRRGTAAGATTVVDARDFLDSDDDGRIDAADREVGGTATDLVLDLAAVWERAFGVDLPDDRPQQLVLAGVDGIAAESVTPAQAEPGWTLLGEPDFLV